LQGECQGLTQPSSPITSNRNSWKLNKSPSPFINAFFPKCSPITSNRNSWKPSCSRTSLPFNFLMTESSPITSNRNSWKQTKNRTETTVTSTIVHRLLQIGIVGNRKWLCASTPRSSSPATFTDYFKSE